MIKSRMMRRAGHVEHMGEKWNAYIGFRWGSQKVGDHW
jgi:hypothetical protein